MTRVCLDDVRIVSSSLDSLSFIEILKYLPIFVAMKSIYWKQGLLAARALLEQLAK